MTIPEFINHFEQRRAIAGNLIMGNGGYNVSRGEAHSLSGFLEDLFALFLAEHCNDHNLEFRVNKCIRYYIPENNNALTFKPDVAIFHNNIFVNYFDVKTDMGRNRYFSSYVDDKNTRVDQIIAAGKVSIGRNNYQVSQLLKYQMVILNGWNINPNTLAENLNYAANLPYVNVCVLRNYIKGQLIINENAFNIIYQSLPQ